MPSDSFRSGQLAQQLPAARITLPAPVQAALRAYDAAGQVTVPAPPRPGEAVAAAIRQAAQQAAQAAAKTGIIDVTAAPAAIAAARRAEQEAADLADAARAAADEARVALCAAADQHAETLTKTVQARHAELVAELAGLAAKLPPGADDQIALDRGGEVREAYLGARDLAAELAALRDLLGVIWPHDQFSGPPGGLERATVWTRDGYLYDQPDDYPAPGTLRFWLRLLAETGPGQVWCPRPHEVQARAAELAGQWHVEKVTARAAAERAGAW